jgi:hypothetical protein
MVKTHTTGTARNRRRLTTLAIAAATTTVIITACGSTSSTAPASNSATASAATADPSASLKAEEAKVIAAYQAYQHAVVKLYASGKADPKILEGTATPEVARQEAQDATVMFSAGDRMVGTLTSTPRSVQITGDTAILITCVDQSKWISVKAGTTPPPGRTGTPPSLARVQLVRDTRDSWVFKDIEEAGKC